MTTRPQRMLPLYEAKLIHQFDHRWATYERDGTVRDVTLSEKRDPDFGVLPRYWVRDVVVGDQLGGRWEKGWLAGWRKLTNSTNERTLVAYQFPLGGLGDSGNLMVENREVWLATTALNSYAADYVARQKLGGTNFNFFQFAQIPVPADLLRPGHRTFWCQEGVQGWIKSRVIELQYTAFDMRGFAEDLGDNGPPFVWDVERRAILRAELDAGFFHLYGVERDDVDYIMETFPIVKRKDIAAHGEFRIKRVILEVYDAMQRAIDLGTEYETILDPRPGHGPRHTSRTEAP